MKKAFLIFSVGVLVGIGFMFFIIKNNEGHSFDDLKAHGSRWIDVETSHADSNLSAYRTSWALPRLSVHWNGKTKCIVHEPESAVTYDTAFFPDFVATHRIKKGYKWSVGLYPEICKDSMYDNKSRPRISIFMIPTMRDTDIVHKPNKIIDYFSLSEEDREFYYQPDPSLIKPELRSKYEKSGALKNFVYDQGTIFP